MSNVYFTNFRTYSEISLIEKFTNLLDASGMKDIDFNGKFVAVKLHFGEMGNMAFLRHQYAQALCSYIKNLGGNPFLTDSNTLYTGSRTNAIDHIRTANLNGFNPVSCPDAPVIIADGVKGTDDVAVPVEGAMYCSEARIGRAVMDADIVVSLTHFKGHESACFGGALKNIGMGCGSRAGKKDMHTSMRPLYDPSKCIGCRKCSQVCAHGCQTYENNRLVLDIDKCYGCGRCIEICPVKALTIHSESDYTLLNRKICEYTKAVVSGRQCFHISFVCDVSPFCDCYGCNDTPIVPDVGMFASFDPVSIDMACIDAVNSQKEAQNSRLTDRDHTNELNDNLLNNHPKTNWKDAVEYAQKIGLGSVSYNLIDIDKKN